MDRNWALLRAIFLIAFLKRCQAFCSEDARNQNNEIDNDYNEQYVNHQNNYNTITNLIEFTCSNVEDLPLRDSDGLPYVIRQHSCTDCSKILQISLSNISVIPPSSLVDFSEFTIIQMDNIGISKIIPGAFNSLNSLNELYLSGNNLTQILDGVFNSLINLQTLDLSRNKIRNLGAHFLTGMIHLKMLDLSSNALLAFEDLVFDDQINLEDVNLSFNNISKFDFKLTANKIQNLNLSHNRISEIKGCISYLNELYLGYNKISSLQNLTCSNDTSNITVLDIGNNSISALDSNIFTPLRTLQVLNLQENQINFIPTGAFSNFNSLIRLNLSFNQLEQFQHGLFENLEMLTYLDLSHNKLGELKRYLHSLQNLKELYLQSNNMMFLDSEQLIKDLPKLSRISIDKNNFSCNDLIGIVHDFRSRGIVVSHGNSKSITNIHGIACREDDSALLLPTGTSADFGENFEQIITSKLDRFLDGDVKKSAMFDYFNKDFKNSNFYKYLESLQKVNSLKFNETEIFNYFNTDFEQSNFYKYMESMKDNQNFSTEFNKSIYKYFDKDFKETGFVKYLDSLKMAGDILDKFPKSTMYNYFNKDFENSKFYKYLEGLKLSQIVLKNYNAENSSKVEKLVGRFDRENNYFGILSTMVVLLVMIVSLMTLLVYFTLNKREKNKQEQVELLEA